MTPHLHAQLRLHGAVIEDRLIEVRGQTWLGECDGAALAFNGAIVAVQVAEGDLWVRGERLDPGTPITKRWGPIELVLEASIPETLPRDWDWVPDPMLLVATVALVLAGAFVDTVWAEFGAGAVAQRVAQSVHTAEERYPQGAPIATPHSEEWPPAATYTSGSATTE